MSTPAERIDAELQKDAGISIVYLINQLLEQANASQASDIHIDPHADSLKVRMRIDGILQTVHTLPKHLQDEIAGRIKILSNLRTDEHQAAQDGRFRIALENETVIDIRVSIVPAYHGEHIVLRLLTDHLSKQTLPALGFGVAACKQIETALRRSHGMILVTGPTGSGKTTTLYSFIKQLNNEAVSIISIEDPIEYAILGTTQIQVNPRHGLSFASGLRSMLRQDPDLVMVGEIRDSETAGIAVNTALTGHLLFSTLHTSDAVTTLPRLRDMSVEPYLIAATVNLIIAQRLVRRTCSACAKTVAISSAQKDSLKNRVSFEILERLTQEKVGVGCRDCNQTGYSGRLSINEVLSVNEVIREAILKQAPAAMLKELAVGAGMTPILEDGVEKVIAGETSLEEVMRVVNE